MVQSEPNTVGSTDFWFDVANRWFFGIVVFAILPLAVIIVLAMALGQAVPNVAMTPELGFATIAILGSAVTDFVMLKTRHQRDNSYKVVAGTRFVVVALTLAVLLLALVYMERQVAYLDPGVVGAGQLVLFGTALYFSALAVWKRREMMERRTALPSGTSRTLYYDYVADSMAAIESELLYIRYAASRCSSLDLKSPGDEDPQIRRLWEDMTARTLEERLGTLEDSLAAAASSIRVELIEGDLTAGPVEQAHPADSAPAK